MFKQNVNKTKLAGPCESPAVSKTKHLKDYMFLTLIIHI